MAAADSYRIQGREVTLPCIVRDASSGNAIFLVSRDVAQRLVPGDAFEVVEAAPGQTQLILGIIDYRDNDLGDYGEVEFHDALVVTMKDWVKLEDRIHSWPVPVVVPDLVLEFVAGERALRERLLAAVA